MRVLVTDSDTRQALATVRALGREGHELITAGVRHPSLASVSRFSSQFERYPDPAERATDFVAALLQIVQRHRVDVILPMTEITTLLIAEHQAQLPAGCRLPFPDIDAVAKAANKADVIVLARELGVPVPQTLVVHSVEEGVRCSAELSYPIVVKPARSRVRVDSGWLSTGVNYATDVAMLKQLLEALPSQTYPVLLQERIQGSGVGVFACFAHDKPVAFFAHRRLREKPPSGGVSVLCESTPLDPDAVEYATRLLRRLRWRGVAMVEFKRDERHGGLRLMEINGRFWGSLQLAVDAGVNFPALALAVAANAQLPAPQPYRVGVRSRWLAGDVDALLMIFLRSRRRLNLPASHPGKWRSLWDFLHIAGAGMSYELERRDDPRPAQLEWRRRLLER